MTPSGRLVLRERSADTEEMWYLAGLGFAAPLVASQLLTISPAVITDCRSGLGHATLAWNAPAGARVQIRIGNRNGTPMTAVTESTGSAETGDWVTDGMVFVLAGSDGYEYARVTARLNCGGSIDTTGAALTASSAYLPLSVGNQWVYRENSRLATSIYFTRTLTTTREVGDRTYFVMETRSQGGAPFETLMRADEKGRILWLNNGSEEVWLDPGGGPAIYRGQAPDVDVVTPAGVLPVGLDYQGPTGLILERGQFARGLGQLSSTATLLTGSSGGFTDGFELIESRIGSGLSFSKHADSIELSADPTILDITGKNVPNCAVPCYFVACGLAPGADPPGTYKPCFQARIRVGLNSCDSQTPVNAALTLVDAAGTEMFTQDIGITVPPGTCTSAAYVRVPLYSIPVTTGTYRLNVKAASRTGEIGAASIRLQVR